MCLIIDGMWNIAIAPLLNISSTDKWQIYTANIFRCPTAQYGVSAGSYKIGEWGSYGYNTAWVGGTLNVEWSGCGQLPAKENQIKKPSETVLMGDNRGAPGNATAGFFNYYNLLLNVGDRHSNGLNVLWVDGHVSWMIRNDLVLGQGDQVYPTYFDRN